MDTPHKNRAELVARRIDYESVRPGVVVASRFEIERMAASGGMGKVYCARDRLEVRAAKIRDPAMRASFLERVPQHARTVELVREWLAGGREGRGGA